VRRDPVERGGEEEGIDVVFRPEPARHGQSIYTYRDPEKSKRTSATPGP
jgi:hypothetical protein